MKYAEIATLVIVGFFFLFSGVYTWLVASDVILSSYMMLDLKTMILQLQAEMLILGGILILLSIPR